MPPALRHAAALTTLVATACCPCVLVKWTLQAANEMASAGKKHWGEPKLEQATGGTAAACGRGGALGQRAATQQGARLGAISECISQLQETVTGPASSAAARPALSSPATSTPSSAAPGAAP